MLPMHATSSKTRSGMKLTALTPLNAGGQPTLVDQNEKAYCYCNQVSFGTVGVIVDASVDAQVGSCDAKSKR